MYIIPILNVFLNIWNYRSLTWYQSDTISGSMLLLYKLELDLSLSMADSDDSHMSVDTSQLSNSILELTTKMTEALNKAQSQNITTKTFDALIGIKLDGSNYDLWSQVVEMYIFGKEKLKFINGDSPQPTPTDPSFCKWHTDNVIVKGWIINSMDSSLIGSLIRFPMAKAIWDSIAMTYFDGSDTSQVYDL